MFRMIDKIDAESIPGKILEIQNEINGLTKKSKVQRLGKSHYKREEKRLSEQLRQLEWLYDFYSRRPRKTTDEVNSVITDDPSDISDAEVESTKTTKLKTAEQKTMTSKTIPEETLPPRQELTQKNAEDIKEIVQEMENRLKEAKVRFALRNKPESPKTEISKDSKIDEKKKVTKLFQRPPQNNLYMTKSLNPLQRRVEPSNLKTRQSYTRKVELKLEETKPKQAATTQRKAISKQENDPKRKKEEKVVKNLNKNEEVKPKTKPGKREVKQSSCEELSKNIPDETNQEIEQLVENDFYITTYRRRVSKLPETTDPTTKRMLQNKFLSKLKSTQPKQSLENNEAYEKSPTKIGNGKAESVTKGKTEPEKQEKKVERKSKYDKIVKAKVNSWNKEYVTYKANKMNESRSKETTRKEESNVKIPEETCKVKEEEKKSLRRVKEKPLRDSLKGEEINDELKKEVKEKSIKPKIGSNVATQKTKNMADKTTKENNKMNEKVNTNKESTKARVEVKERASKNISNELSSATLIAFQMVEQEVVKGNSDFKKENKSNKRSVDTSNKKLATQLKEDDEWYIGELTPSTSQELLETPKPENVTDYAKPGCSKSDPSQEEISKNFPLEKKPSIITLEKKDSVVIVKSPKQHILESKKPALNVADANQKNRNKSADRKSNKSDATKIEVDVKGLMKNKKPPLEVIFRQKLDRRTILVEKLIDYRIDLIHQNFKAEKTDEFSKPSITYI